MHRKRIQVDAYNSCKTDLKQDEAILNVDYSESYKNKQQDEIQSAYFGQSTFSLFTASVYHLDGSGSLIKRPIAVVSESSDHSRIAALTCIDFVVKEVEKHIALTKIILWSDVRRNSDHALFSSSYLHTVPICSSIGITMKPIMAKGLRTV